MACQYEFSTSCPPPPPNILVDPSDPTSRLIVIALLSIVLPMSASVGLLIFILCLLRRKRKKATAHIPPPPSAGALVNIARTARGPGCEAAAEGAPGDQDSEAQGQSSSSFQSDKSLHFEWRVAPDRLKIRTRPDGTDWQLGAGAFGVVYLAILDNIEHVAVKSMTIIDGGQSQVKKFEQELNLMRAARHRNVVSFIGGLIEQPHLYIIQEYCTGGDLFTAIANDSEGDFLWHQRGRKIVLDVAYGLQYFHSNNVVHFDIKSSNILLARDGTAKIADVGLAQVLRTNTHIENSMRGTWDWCSPEMLTGLPSSKPSDIWSLGIVLWEIVTGERPSRGRNRRVSTPAECPEVISELIARCTACQAVDRPTAADVIAVLLQTESDCPE